MGGCQNSQKISAGCSQGRRQMEKDELEEDVAAKDSSEVDGLWEWTRKIK